MAWSGYVALGNSASSVFTELSVSGYARQSFTFNSAPLDTKLAGTGSGIAFAQNTTGSNWSYGALAFFTASSGGNPVLVYPLPATVTVVPGATANVQPATVEIDLVGMQTQNGVALDPNQVLNIAGTLPTAGEATYADGLTAHAGGGQTSALQLAAQVNRVTTVATAFDSVMLPISEAGDFVTIINAASKPMQVFGNGNDQINGQAAATGVAQPPNSVDTYWCSSAGNWYAEVGAGFSAGMMTESAQDSIVAHAGGGQSSATQISAQTARVTTVATAGDSIKLPASAPGLELNIINAGANPMQVYGSGTDTIDGVAAATGVSQMVNSMCIYSCPSSGTWVTNGLGTGYSSGWPTVSYVNGLTAHSGGGQASATPITACITRFTTVGTAANSALLPASAGGMQITVNNAAASNSMNIYGTGSDSINSAGSGVAYALAAGKTVQFSCAVAGQWHALLSS